ncbi:uncharacterized protein MICPUCDRAFT_50468 [Micromonas pusilla CCMP1545]|uniref:Predicted protein n=1 Tax=Micromonas pusilla (strain CCMP1545) TaxID=564608 RepID=C1MI79_MICPC|nr:uncharacterized protein MICPUCDRAFT_50468 [Micromonas pusilla CCMP1545]EEH60875.1 predicted protein [Micromonas pusilla CCMP1545]|eukprot:XP_003055623.1 predicted protein [Micromonas pusilla CCMP1545]
MGCFCCAEPIDEEPEKREPPTRRSLSGKHGANLRAVSVVSKLHLSVHDQGHPLEKYDVLDVIGTGGFAVVKRVREKRTGKNYAMKIINVAVDASKKMVKKPSDEDDADDEVVMSVKEVLSEIETLRTLRHDAILRLISVYVQPEEKHVYVVTELLHGGAVLDAILKMKDERYTEAEAKVVVRRTLEGIQYMHENGVVHRDLKLENLLLKRDDDLSSVVIADFGLAKRCRLQDDARALPHAKGVDDSAVGTPVYAAPEVVEKKSYGAAVDMWSLGVIGYIVVTGAMPRDLWKKALKHGRIEKDDFGFDCYEWDTVSQNAKDFIVACLTLRPKDRMTSKAALNHPWMKNVENVKPAPLRIKNKLRDFAKGMKLPTKKYAKGDYLIKQGQRAVDVFLIKRGTVDVLVEDAFGENVKVATREAGEFIGEMSVGAGVLRSNSSKSGSEPSTPKGGGGGVGDEKGATSAKGAKGEKDSSSSSSKNTSPSWGAALVAVSAAKKWIGPRRTASVVAATEVECLVLGKREMEWAVTHDESIKNELARQISSRRDQTEEKLERRASTSRERPNRV